MSSRRYSINLTSVDDGVYTTEPMTMDYHACDFRIVFYDNDGNPVAPTAGTVTPELQSLPGQWMGPGAGDTSLDATKCGTSAAYDIPYFGSCGGMGRITLSGVTGAARALAVFTTLD